MSILVSDNSLIYADSKNIGFLYTFAKNKRDQFILKQISIPLRSRNKREILKVFFSLSFTVAKYKKNSDGGKLYINSNLLSGVS